MLKIKSLSNRRILDCWPTGVRLLLDQRLKDKVLEAHEVGCIQGEEVIGGESQAGSTVSFSAMLEVDYVLENLG